MTRPVFSFPICALTGVLMMWASALVAQPVLTSSDLPQGGQTYLRATAVPPLFSEGLEDSGAGLTWDYSDLISTGDQETEYFPMSEAGFTTQFIFSSADHFTAFELPDLGLEKRASPSLGPPPIKNLEGRRTKPLGWASPPISSICRSSMRTKKNCCPCH